MLFQRSHTSLRQTGDEKLMELLNRGDHAALDELYSRYSTRLLAYFDRMLDRDTALAQDFLHDLFLKIIERPSMFDTSRSFPTWMYSIAHNMCKNEFRRRQVRLHQSFEDDEHAAEHVDYAKLVDHADFARVLDDELSRLAADMRTTFLLRYQDELSVREIALIVDVPEGTVKSRLFNIAQRLSRRLAVYRPGTGINTDFDVNLDLEINNERYG
ncbi:MAG: sigma-70 family RNA polymerase sigma factor [bacterium]|nr:sigma-70 family RNA polymerase sigma factor [Candidatus Kapabacteria bacterium]